MVSRPPSLPRRRRGDRTMSRKKPRDIETPQPGEPVPSYEQPRTNPGARWKRKLAEDRMEEASEKGWDTPINRRQFLDVAKKVGTGVAASSFLYPAFLAACGKTADQLTPASGGRFDVQEAGGGETIN